MANLVSPGVAVSVIDESISVGSGEGTVPFIMIATAQDKSTPDGTSIADGTTKENANRLQLMTSQRELLQTFGEPNFQKVGGNSIHGSPLNEYGLLAAHSYLGLANRAYVLRADIDLGQLDATTIEPTAPMPLGTVWFNTGLTQFGIFMVTDVVDLLPVWTAIDATYVAVAPGTLPAVDAANNGEYGVDISASGVTTYKVVQAGVWVALDAATGDFQTSTLHPNFQADGSSPLTSGDHYVRTVPSAAGAQYIVSVLGTSGQYVLASAPMIASADLTTADLAATAHYGTDLVSGDFYVFGTEDTSVYNLRRYNAITAMWTDYTTAVASESVPITGPSDQTLWYNPDVGLDGSGNSTVDMLVNNGSGSWEPLRIPGFDTAPITATATATVDEGTGANDPGTILSIAVDNGGSGYTVAPVVTITGANTGVAAATAVLTGDVVTSITVDTAGTGYGIADIAISVAAPAAVTEPVLYLQSADPIATGATLKSGDIWVDTDQIAEYPVIYRYSEDSAQWVQVDNTDQTSNAGIVFADARPDPEYTTAGTNDDNNGGGDAMDIDVPDPDAYPLGMLLWNTRFSTRNTKQWNDSWTVTQVTASGLPVIEGRWVSVSGNAADGSPHMGSNSQRAIVVQAIQAALIGNEDVRSEFLFYNLIATPGYPETIDEMVALNVDRKETAFIIADTPFDLSPASTELLSWSSNADNAADNGQDGLVTADPYLGVYYPSGLSTNIDGTNVVVPPSHMMLRTMLFNDQVAYPWFAPAGLSRGRISNAATVGYVNGEGEFQPVSLNQGQRDVLYTNNVNPIAFVPNEGLVAFGQKTRNPFDSALSRINVARLVNYIRYQAEELARPFLFEPNDAQTRNNVKDAYDRFLSELVTLRGLTDFLTVCDESNNTPVRIDKNELWIDLAIVPTKAIEFIYIPIRIKNTGADLSASTGN